MEQWDLVTMGVLRFGRRQSVLGANEGEYLVDDQGVRPKRWGGVSYRMTTSERERRGALSSGALTFRRLGRGALLYESIARSYEPQGTVPCRRMGASDGGGAFAFTTRCSEGRKVVAQMSEETGGNRACRSELRGDCGRWSFVESG